MMPDSIHDYKILDELGEGGFGKVFKVQSVDQQLYALKLISVNKDTKDDAKKQAELYIALNHPNILKAREFFFFNQEKYLTIILEYCPEGSLCKLVGKSDPDSFRKILKGITEGLVYLHNKNIIHRDIKPQNILLLNGVAKLADLGISKLMKTSGISTKIGTLFYLAPEVFHKDKYDTKADIWSLGIMMLELLVGKRIYDLVEGMLAPSLVEGFPFPALLSQIKDKEMRELLQIMLKKKPDERLSAQQVLDVLNGKKVKSEEPKKHEPIKILLQQKPYIEIKKVQEPKKQINEWNGKYRFSEWSKSSIITLSNNNCTATSPAEGFYGYLEGALIQGRVLKKGSSIRFYIQQANAQIRLGIAHKDSIGCLYRVSTTDKPNKCYLLSYAGQHNNVFAKGGKGDKIKVQTNGNELLFFNQSTKKEDRIAVVFGDDEWNDVRFCVALCRWKDSVTIL